MGKKGLCSKKSTQKSPKRSPREEILALKALTASKEEDLKDLKVELKRKNERNQDLQVANEDLKTQNEDLKTQNEELKTKNEEIKTENERLKKEIESLKAKKTDLIDRNQNLHFTNDDLEEMNDDFRKKNADLMAEIEVLRSKIPKSSPDPKSDRKKPSFTHTIWNDAKFEELIETKVLTFYDSRHFFSLSSHQISYGAKPMTSRTVSLMNLFFQPKNNLSWRVVNVVKSAI